MTIATKYTRGGGIQVYLYFIQELHVKSVMRGDRGGRRGHEGDQREIALTASAVGWDESAAKRSATTTGVGASFRL